jgi:hypothetical protein
MEVRMKSALPISLTIFTAFLSPQMAAANVCIKVSSIADTHNDPAGKFIIFTMRDGRVWRNDFPTPCPDLKFDGFAWTLQGTEQVCDRQESIRVVQSGEICALGNFTDVTPVKHK